MIPILHSSGVIIPGQFGPINLELLLFAIGKAKSTARGQAKILYHTELSEWSRWLQSAIEVKSKYKEHKDEDELAVFLEANESKF